MTRAVFGIVMFLFLIVYLAVLMNKSWEEGIAKAEARQVLYRANHPDAIECRKRGGYPVWSAFGAFIDCKAFPKLEAK